MTRYPFCRRTVWTFAAALCCSALPAFSAFPAAREAGTDMAAPPSGWHARITGNDASPQRLIAVDKKQQTLFLFERRSPLRLAGQFSCTTGQGEGDKLVEGDLKTPEGVYFVVRRLSSGLDYEKYGSEAYTLNYPNPVDRLRRKTGYGIWIHGRGVPITPNLTEGCVSLNNADIAMLGKTLTPGTPVALAAGVNFAPAPLPEDIATIVQLHKKTYGWAAAWSARSKNFFDYYDQEAYGIAQGESFAAFRQQKERVFSVVKWIDARVANVQALQGPGYWVTWFQQNYRASNLSSRGVRRLYWRKDKKGELRIVGMEWEPYLSGTLTAGLGETFIPSAEQAAATAPVSGPPPSAALPRAGEAPGKSPEKSPGKSPEKPAEKPVAVALAEPVKPVPARAAEESPPLKTTDVAAFVERWRAAWQSGNLDAYAACYARDAAQGSRSGLAAIRSHKRGLWRKSSPKEVVLTNMRITKKQDTLVVDMHQSYTDSNSFADMGVKTLYLKMENHTLRITREDWSLIQQ